MIQEFEKFVMRGSVRGGRVLGDRDCHKKRRCGPAGNGYLATTPGRALHEEVTEPLLPSRALLGALLWKRWRRECLVPGAEYEEGFFFRFAGAQLLAARPWGPGSGAWMIDARTSLRWHGAEPWLDIAGPNLRFPRAADPAPWDDPTGSPAPWSQLQLPLADDVLARAWNERASALPRALETVPEWARRRVSRVDASFQWRMLRWLEATGEPGAELCDGNLALAVLLALRGERCGIDAREAVGWRRRRVLEALGLPGRATSVRLLGKLSGRALRPDLVAHVAGWLREPRATERIAHVRRIGVAGLIFQDAAEFDWFDDALLFHLLETEEVRALQVLYHYMAFARRLRALGYPVRTPVPSLTRLVSEFDALRLRHDALEGLESCRALAPPPIPPIPGFIEALRSVAEIDAEAERMRHCVRDYARDAIDGEVALYRVLEPQRATLCLEPSQRGGWRISELRLEANRHPDRRTIRAVAAWRAKHVGRGGREACAPVA